MTPESDRPSEGVSRSDELAALAGSVARLRQGFEGGGATAAPPQTQSFRVSRSPFAGSPGTRTPSQQHAAGSDSSGADINSAEGHANSASPNKAVDLPPIPSRSAASARRQSEPLSTTFLPPPLPPRAKPVVKGSPVSESAVAPPMRSAIKAPASMPSTPPRREIIAIDSGQSCAPPVSLPPPRRLANAAVISSEPRDAANGEPDDSGQSSDEEEEHAVAASLASGLSLDASPGDLSAASTDDFPDASNANRRPPVYTPDCVASSKSPFYAVAVHGHTVVAASERGVKIFRVGATAQGGAEKLCTIGEHKPKNEIRLTAIGFRPPAPTSTDDRYAQEDELGLDAGRFVWCGTKSGELWELDVSEAAIVSNRLNLHSAPIVRISRVGSRILSLDAEGKMCVWGAGPTPGVELSGQPRSQRIPMDKDSCHLLLGNQLWVCTGSGTSHSSKSALKDLRIRIYSPFTDDTQPFNATSRPISIPHDLGTGVGAVTCGTVIPTSPALVYLGHDSGHVSIWSRSSFTCTAVKRIARRGVTAMTGVGSRLWTGDREGRITVYDVDAPAWAVVKNWPAHKHAITSLSVDLHSVDGAERLQVLSVGLDSAAHLWDGLLAADWLDAEIDEHQSRFCQTRHIKVLCFTFNIDACVPSELQASERGRDWLVEVFRAEAYTKSGEEDCPHIIHVGLQEVIDLLSKKLTAKSLIMERLSKGSKGSHDYGDRVSHQYRAWYDLLVYAIRLAMPPSCPYKVVCHESMVGLLSLVFVRHDCLPSMRKAASSSVKTGIGGRYGNKGAVVTRVVLDDTSLCFVNCHLAAGQKHVKQRNEDLADILESTPFEELIMDPPVFAAGGDGAMISDHERVFLSGDLNYRINLRRPLVLSHLAKSDLQPLLAADQLRNELLNNRSFRLRPFVEASISFIPTYKYDRNSDLWDTSDKARIPAWCDRVLWRSRAKDDVRCTQYRRWEVDVSDHRPVSATLQVRIRAIDAAKRAAVKKELNSQWRIMEADLLSRASQYYKQFV